MKRNIWLVAIMAGLMGLVAVGAEKQKTCCEKAIEQKKECANKCCIKAHKEGKSCTKCNPNKEDLKLYEKKGEKK
jgi:hypothetical protein